MIKTNTRVSALKLIPRSYHTIQTTNGRVRLSILYTLISGSEMRRVEAPFSKRESNTHLLVKVARSQFAPGVACIWEMLSEFAGNFGRIRANKKPRYVTKYV